MAYLDRKRAEKLMAEAGLDALVTFSPESFYYASGAPAGVATMWRSAGAVAVVVPASASEPETAIVSDLFAGIFSRNSHITDVRESPLWVETTTLDSVNPDLPASEMIEAAWKHEGRKPGFARPETFDASVCYQHIADTLAEKGIAEQRIGYEGAALTVNELSEFSRALAHATLIDATNLLSCLKMVKSEGEINNLRQAVQLAEKGINAVRDSIAEGVSRDTLAGHWSAAIERHRADLSLTGSWEYISVGPDPWGSNKTIESGDLIKVDVGCLVDGYTSDTGRTFVYGAPTQQQTDLYEALLAGFTAGSELLRPGVALKEVHAAAQTAIRGAGFPGYSRGEFGHGLGASLGSEQWPFISADADTRFEPGMVMAFECPWYINGLGGMIVENQLLITPDGHEMMNSLPLELVEICG